MADKGQIRKIQFTGKSSYIVSLPKDWIKDQGLKQGEPSYSWKKWQYHTRSKSQLILENLQEMNLLIL